MQASELFLKGCFIITPHVFSDDRGMFFETFRENWFKKNVCDRTKFVQENQSVSSLGVLRGLHFQKEPHQQAKLIRIIKGVVQDVVVDLRPKSPSFGKYYSTLLSEKNQKMIFVPKGFAHGFLSLSEEVVLHYKCDDYYKPESQSGIHYADPLLNIIWNPDISFTISEKDHKLPGFNS